MECKSYIKEVGRRVHLSRPWLLPAVDRVHSRFCVDDNKMPQIRRAKQADGTVSNAKESARPRRSDLITIKVANVCIKVAQTLSKPLCEFHLMIYDFVACFESALITVVRLERNGNALLTLLQQFL